MPDSEEGNRVVRDERRLKLLTGVIKDPLGRRYDIVIEFHPSRPQPVGAVALTILIDPEEPDSV